MGGKLAIQAELKLKWDKEKYVDNFDGEDSGAIAWLRLGERMVSHMRNDNGILLCPLCDDQDSW